MYERIYLIGGKKLSGTCIILYYHCVKAEHRRLFAKQMDDLIRWAKPISAEEGSQLNNGEHYAGVTFDDGFLCVINNALPELAKRRISATLFVPTGCLGCKPLWIKGRKNQEPLDVVVTADQLKGLAKDDLVSIGSHCVTHSNLLFLNEEEARREIFESKTQLENTLERQVKILSFPHGAFNQTHVRLAQEAGYERVFSILPTLANSGSDGYVTGRVAVDPTDWQLEFRLKLFGAYRWLPLAFTMKRRAKSLLAKSGGSFLGFSSTKTD